MPSAPRPYIHDDFLLDTGEARTLYHDHARDLPIIDYHCHLDPGEIARDHRWRNLADIWLGGDHYKWRAMRAAGFEERLITGDASDEEKFRAWAATVPRTLRNPLHHWTHLELSRYFGIDDLLGPDNADAVYAEANQRMKEEAFSARGLLQAMRVEVVCTTDDPVDDLEHHRAIRENPSCNITVLPTWRPDKALAIDNAALFNPWIDQLADRVGSKIDSMDDLLAALRTRHDAFAAAGCRLSDRGLTTIEDADFDPARAASVFSAARKGQHPGAAEAAVYRTFLLHELAAMDGEKDWAMQIHYGALRNTNTRMFEVVGPDTGFDTMDDRPAAAALAAHFDRLEQAERLPRTILYSLNPNHFEMLAAMIGNFQRGPAAGKLQLGSGWWFNDQIAGMTRQIEALSQHGLLPTFVGMLTDSRSFLSYTRHEYFRRLLCRILGRDMHDGLLPADTGMVGGMVANISYHNARGWFGFAG